MSVRNFKNTTTVGTLTAPIASSSVTFTVTGFTGTPTTPFTATLDRNLASEEVVLVTAVTGGTITATRGYDGTAAQSHAAGGTIEHTAGAIEYTEANQHVNATVGVHGTTGSLVGSDGSQTIFKKTLVSPVLQADPTAGDAAVAFIPVGSEARNLFRGVGSDGLDKITVNSSGKITTVTDTAVGGNLTVTGTATVTGAAATGPATINGPATVNGAGTVTGLLTVGGGANVTGAVTATGLVKGAGAESTAGLTVAQLSAAPTGVASKSQLWAQTDGGVYTRSGTGGAARVPVHWGSGTSFPASPMIGDRYEHTGLQCVMVFTTNGWRQDKISEVATLAARDAISTTYSTWLTQGFQVVQTDKSLLWEWNGSAWHLLRSTGTPLGVGLVVTGATNTTSPANVTGYSVTDNSSGLISVNAGTGVITFNARGRVAFNAEVVTDNGSARYQITTIGIPATAQIGFANMTDQRETPAGFPSGGTARQLLTATWAVSPGDTTYVSTYSSIASTLQAYVNATYL